MKQQQADDSAAAATSTQMMDTLFVFIVGQFLHSSQTDINQTSDPNRCECDPSIAPDTPISTPERLIYRLLPLRGWSVWRRSVKAADRCRQSDPVSRFTVQISGRQARRSVPVWFFFLLLPPLVAIKKISVLHSKNSATLSHCAFKRCHRDCLLFFLLFFSSSSSLPTKIKSSGAQARHFSTKLSLIFQRLLTLRTQLPACLQCVIRSGEECGRLCSGAIKKKEAFTVSVLCWKVWGDGRFRAHRCVWRAHVPEDWWT